MPVVQEYRNAVFQQDFISSHSGSAHVKAALEHTAEVLSDFYQNSDVPYKWKSEQKLHSDIAEMLFHTESPHSLSNVLSAVKKNIIQHSMNISHPQAMAHLHCPPLIPAICADMIVSALNQSMDSWDQSPAATAAEQHMTEWLCRLYKLPASGAGTFTTGGTQSNYMGLLMARDHYCLHELGHDVKHAGLPLQAHRFKILCSEEAHFTVKKSAAQLGLGEKAVISIPTDDKKRMLIEHTIQAIEQLKSNGDVPLAIVGTAGTTDFGSIDPLPALADLAGEENIWFHVDAAFGGALVLSSQHADKLEGIRHADSITVDFHKLFYQPISCGAFLVKNEHSFNLLAHQADYLNPEDDKQAGIVHLVDRSVQTTRRFDALKVLVTLKTLGTDKWGAMIDQSLDSTALLAQEIRVHPALELVIEPEMNAVVFRYRLHDSLYRGSHLEDEINKNIQQQLYSSGRGVIAKTRINGVQYLKCTLLNPLTNMSHIKKLIEEVTDTGREIELQKIKEVYA
ncbi:pyridoxal phosphate-dependent decarboxylase family protein [Alteribacillus sp. HJP-4]|uniref:pyridoxal phosphate-dependent decarboxylase family protein n=1 Tax=Alteribacillus sp. HJP-4 TaxID=2775394 RepID=UPI0035CCF4BE